MKRRTPATAVQHKAAAQRLLAMKRLVDDVFRDLGVSHDTPPATPSVTAKETDALLALRRAIDKCAMALNARMTDDGQPPRDWDYYDTLNQQEPHSSKRR